MHGRQGRGTAGSAGAGAGRRRSGDVRLTVGVAARRGSVGRRAGGRRVAGVRAHERRCVAAAPPPRTAPRAPLAARRCAIKIISKKVFKSKEDHDDMLREVEIMKRVAGHPNLVNIFTHYEDKDRFVIVLELATGGDVMGRIEKMLERGEHFSERVASRYFKHMLLSVKHCHDKLVVHRCVARGRGASRAEGGQGVWRAAAARGVGRRGGGRGVAWRGVGHGVAPASAWRACG
jgi:hypothetical protein